MHGPIQGPAIKQLLTICAMVYNYRMSKNLKRKSGPSRRRSKVQKLTYLSPESQSSSDDEWEPEELRITDNDVPSGSGKH